MGQNGVGSESGFKLHDHSSAGEGGSLGANVVGSGNILNGAIGISKFAAGATGEGAITIMPQGYSAIGQGTWVVRTIASCIFGGIVINSSGSNGDNISFSFTSDEGTYTIRVLYTQDTASALVDTSLDGTNIATGTQFYANTDNVVNNVLEIPGVVLTKGKHTLKFTANGKHVYSSAYSIQIQGITLIRTT